jgi:hypothetical protein
VELDAGDRLRHAVPEHGSERPQHSSERTSSRRTLREGADELDDDAVVRANIVGPTSRRRRA